MLGHTEQNVCCPCLFTRLVCIAVFHAASSSSLPGKALGLWGPITAFVAMGLEHSGRAPPPALALALVPLIP